MPTLAGDKQMVLPTDDRHVPVPGGRRGRRDDQVHRGRRRRRRPGRLRAAAGHRRPAQGARAGRLRPPPGPRRGQGEQPHLALGIGRPGRHRCGDGRGRGPRVRGHLHPAHPRRLDRDVRLRRGLGRRPRPADPAHDQPGAARDPHGARARERPAGAEHPGQDPRHRRRLRRQGAGLPGLRARGRRLADRRQAGQVDRGPLGEPPGRLVRPRLPHQHPRSAPTKAGKHHRR